TAPDVPREAAREGIAGYFGRLMMTFDAPPQSLVPVVDEYARRFPDDPELAQMEAAPHGQLTNANAAALAEGRLQTLVQSANPAVRAFAEEKMRIKRRRERPAVEGPAASAWGSTTPAGDALSPALRVGDPAPPIDPLAWLKG